MSSNIKKGNFYESQKDLREKALESLKKAKELEEKKKQLNK